MANKTALSSKHAYETSFQMLRIARDAVRKTQEENREKGIPNAYCVNGKTVYEMPDGTMTTKNPFEMGSESS